MSDGHPAGAEPDPDEPRTAGEPPRRSELAQRIVTGLLFGALALALVWAGPLPFAGLVLMLALVMAWEWSHIVRAAEVDLALLFHALGVAAAVGLAATGLAALGLLALAIATILVFLLALGERPLLSALGVLYAGLPAVALLWLRASEPFGLAAVLLVLGVVAATDIAAYATGRSLGGPRLAPRISPGKTWSGLAGGLLAACVAGALAAVIVGSPPLPLAVLGLALGLVSQIGDLAESALKRRFGLKDASNLLPGHGGFMDRLDGIVAAAVAAGLIALFADPQAPAKALFFLT